jgi:hypothetical protein
MFAQELLLTALDQRYENIGPSASASRMNFPKRLSMAFGLLLPAPAGAKRRINLSPGKLKKRINHELVPDAPCYRHRTG